MSTPNNKASDEQNVLLVEENSNSKLWEPEALTRERIDSFQPVNWSDTRPAPSNDKETKNNSSSSFAWSDLKNKMMSSSKITWSTGGETHRTETPDGNSPDMDWDGNANSPDTNESAIQQISPLSEGSEGKMLNSKNASLNKNEKDDETVNTITLERVR